MSQWRRAMCASMVSTLALAALPVLAQDAGTFPNKPIRIVVPTAPGGGLDVLVRQVAQKMSERLGQPMVVDNRTGAFGIIGAEAVVRAPADGYTLLFPAAAIAINEALGMKLPFDVRKDFTPVSLVATAPVLIVAHPSTPYRNLKDIVEAAKSKPEGVAYATAGTGAITHLLGEALRAQSGANLVSVAYKGAGPALADVVAGHVPLLIDAYTPGGVQVVAGKLRGLAIASSNRSPLLPDVPTTAEQGYPKLVGSGFYGLLAPAGTPAPIIDKLNATVVAVLREPEMRERLIKQGYEVQGSTPAEYGAFLAAEIARWTPVIKGAGIKVEQ